MFQFRDEVDVDSGFGRHLVEVLRRSSPHATHRRVGLKELFLYDSPDGLQAVELALFAIRRETRSFYPQHEELLWALSRAGSLLVVRQGGKLHYLASEDEDWFEALRLKPFKVKDFLKNFRGVRGRHGRGKLSVVKPPAA